jgi:hypothetical protein
MQERIQPPTLKKQDRTHKRWGDAASGQGDQKPNQPEPVNRLARLIPIHQHIEASQ